MRANVEIGLDFIKTHLSMVILLMPWKALKFDGKIEHLFTLFDILHLDRLSTIMGTDADADDPIYAKTHAFLWMSVLLLFVTIASFALTITRIEDIRTRMLVDGAAFFVSAALLVLSAAFQAEFDDYFKAHFGVPGVDYGQIFMTTGIIIGQTLLTLLCAGSKAKELTSKSL